MVKFNLDKSSLNELSKWLQGREGRPSSQSLSSGERENRFEDDPPGSGLHGGGAEITDPTFGRDLGSESPSRLRESDFASADQQLVRHDRQGLEKRERKTQTCVRPHRRPEEG